MVEDLPSPHLPAVFQAMLDVINVTEYYRKILIVATAVENSFEAA